MLASLDVIVFTAIRRDLALGHGLPFGAVFAGLQIDSISSLWSMEFWSIVFHARKNSTTGKTRRRFLVALIFLCTVLGVSVGPSTANLMRPRLSWWKAGGTTFWINATSVEMFPSTLRVTPQMQTCDLYDINGYCIFAGYETIAASYLSQWRSLEDLDNLPESIYVPSEHAERQMVRLIHDFHFLTLTSFHAASYVQESMNCHL